MIDYIDRLPISNCILDGEKADAILKTIEPPRGMMVAYKVVHLIPLRVGHDRKPTVKYNGIYRDLQSMSAHHDLATRYFPGTITTPPVDGSLLFTYTNSGSAASACFGTQAIYRCFIPTDSQVFDHLPVPITGSLDKQSCAKFWQYEKLCIPQTEPTRSVSNVALTKYVVLMNRLA